MMSWLAVLAMWCAACDATIIAQPDAGSYPTCASLGCLDAPSGTPETWSPCTDDLCWCGSPAERCVQSTRGDL